MSTALLATKFFAPPRPAHDVCRPLLTKRLLQHGANHPLFHAGVTLMEQLLDELDNRDPDEPKATAWQELTNAMIKALIAEGLSQEKLKIALGSLELARKTPLSGL